MTGHRIVTVRRRRLWWTRTRYHVVSPQGDWTIRAFRQRDAADAYLAALGRGEPWTKTGTAPVETETVPGGKGG